MKCPAGERRSPRPTATDELSLCTPCADIPAQRLNNANVQRKVIFGSINIFYCNIEGVVCGVKSWVELFVSCNLPLEPVFRTTAVLYRFLSLLFSAHHVQPASRDGSITNHWNSSRGAQPTASTIHALGTLYVSVVISLEKSPNVNVYVAVYLLFSRKSSFVPCILAIATVILPLL